MKKILGVYSAPRPHWVGDGFPVRSLFSLRQPRRSTSARSCCSTTPGRREFAPTRTAARRRRASAPRLRDRDHRLRGRGRAPRLHRRRRHDRPRRRAVDDGGVGHPARGIPLARLHARRAARFEMVQLWVNLPAKDKMAAPGYQTLARRRHSGGRAARRRGQAARDRRQLRRPQRPGATFTPINVWDVRLKPGHDRERSTLPEGLHRRAGGAARTRAR